MNQNPAERRGWVQTGGMPVDDIHRDMRDAIDRVDRVQYIGGACFKMFDRAGAQIGIVQMQGAEGARLDEAVMATTQRLALGEERKPDPLAGDTIVRELDLRNPGDADLYARARSGEMAAVSFPDIERTDPPPIVLPDYVPQYDAPPPRFVVEPGTDDRDMQRIEGGRWLLLVVLFAVAAIVAGIVAFSLSHGSASHG